MEYNCVDKGGEKCPCVLMEAGQCYICTMSRTGRCSCGQQWKGLCPYNEFVQNGGKPSEALKEFAAPVLKITDYSEHLKVVRLKVPAGFAQKCQSAGSYIMVNSLGYKVPLSVLCSTVFSGEGGSEGYIELAIQPAGPKTLELFRPDNECWIISGPFAAGLVNVESLDYTKPVLVVAKGTAAAPYINIRSRIEGRIFVDTDKLTDGFIEEYLGDKLYKKVSLQNDMEKIMKEIDTAGPAEQIMFLASPYYTEKILQMRPGRINDIIIPNHANICCGVGICGACSYTDKDGVTVRRCKITER